MPAGRFASSARRVMSPADGWAAWRDLLGMAKRFAARAVETDGREVVEHDNLRHQLAAIISVRFPVAGESAAEAAAAFKHQARATLEVLLPERRAILAPALIALADCLDALLIEQDAQYRRRCGGD